MLVNPDGSRQELYNMSVASLSDSFFESQNLASANGAVASAMTKAALAWHHSIPPERPGATDASMRVFGALLRGYHKRRATVTPLSARHADRNMPVVCLVMRPRCVQIY